jgi:RHS repeat-associated protein
MMLSEAACPDQARKKTQYFYVMVDGVEILRETKYFLGKYEIEIDDAGNERKLHYISAGDGVFAIVEKVNQADAQIHYIHKNYLGSYDAITNHLGVVEERLSFDPWGRRRNPSTGIVDDGIYSMFDRGFTGHQHLDEFGLINMNGRLYDPVLARFLSPDPFVQAPDNLQNHNRYSYALNNPLIYTDPSGEFIFTALALLIPGAQFLLPIAIGADLGALTGGIRGANSDVGFWGGAWRGAAVGVVAGSLSIIGGGTFAVNLAWGAGEGAVTGGFDAALWGNDIGRGMAWGAASGMAFASITSGIESIQNAKDGYGFGTDIGRFNKMVKEGDFQESLNFWSFRNNGPSMVVGSENNTDLFTGNISIARSSFENGPHAARAAIAHEWGHYYNDIVWSIVDIDPSLDGIDFRISGRPANHVKAFSSSIGDVSMSGYDYAMKQSGKFHIGLKWIKGGTKYYNSFSGDYAYRYFPYNELHWKRSYGLEKWFHLLPRRF